MPNLKVYAVVINSNHGIVLPRMFTPDLIVLSIQSSCDTNTVDQIVSGLIADKSNESQLFQEISRTVKPNLTTVILVRSKLLKRSQIGELTIQAIPPASKVKSFIMTRFCIEEKEDEQWSGSYSTSCSIVNVQLSSQLGDIERRASELEQLFDVLEQSDLVVVFGKFNFSLHNTTASDSSQLVIAKMFTELLAHHDELILHTKFHDTFQEFEISFPPTPAPVQKGCCLPSLPSLPGWADRIFFSKNVEIHCDLHEKVPNEIACVASYKMH